MTQFQDTQTRPFVVFAQMARHGRMVVMAFTVFIRNDLAKVRRALKRARMEAGVPVTLRADSRNLFAPAAAGSPVSSADAPTLLARYVDAMNAVPSMLRYSYLDLDKAPDNVDPDDPELLPKLRDVMIQACFAVPAGGKHGPQAHECDVLLVDNADREAHSTALMLDLADVLPHALARATIDPDGYPWARRELDRIKYWSNIEVTARTPDPSETQPAA